MSSFTDPIPSDGRLIRAVRRAHEYTQQAQLLARIARETDGKIERAVSRHFEFPNPVDLRGIPILGPGINGTIRGTNPEAITHRET